MPSKLTIGNRFSIRNACEIERRIYYWFAPIFKRIFDETHKARRPSAFIDKWESTSVTLFWQTMAWHFLPLLVLVPIGIATAATPSSRNVLYIVFDDLRPDLSAYDVPFMQGKTPSIQQLADTGTLFERAYCQQAVCSPSRNSFATGRRPNSTKVWK